MAIAMCNFLIGLKAMSPQKRIETGPPVEAPNPGLSHARPLPSAG